MVFGIMVERIKKNKVKVLIVCFLIYCFIIFYIMPVNESLTPVINSMQGKIYPHMMLEETQGIVFWGKNMRNIDKAYIDGKEHETCKILNNSDDMVTVYIPKEVYNAVDSFDIQFSSNEGIYKYKSGKFTVDIAKDENVKPQILNVSKNEIYTTQGKQKILVTAKDMTENSKLFINDNEVAEAMYDYNDDKVIFYVTPEMYAGKTELSLSVCNYVDGMKVAQSDVVKILVNDVDLKSYEHNYEFAQNNRLITHAAGIWKGETYTNCQEAFEENYQKGCRMFEIDLMLTRDGVIIGRHDWNAGSYGYQGANLVIEKHQINNLPKSYQEVCEMYSDRTPLTWEKIIEYMMEDESLYIVTDSKNYNDESVEAIFTKIIEITKSKNCEEILDRVVVQVYSQDMYKKVMSIYPFKSVIYTLYQSLDSNQQVLDFIDNSNVRVITLPASSSRDDEAFFQELNNRGCYIYVHTINDMSKAAEYLARGCYGIYTDNIINEQLAEVMEMANDLKVKMEEQKAQQEQAAQQAEADKEQENTTEYNKKFLLNFLEEINDDDYLILLSVVDEATNSVDDDIAQALEKLGVSPQYRDAFLSGYVGIMSEGQPIYEEFSKELLEYTFIDTETENLYYLRSAGSGVEGGSSICINGVEYLNNYTRGLHMVIYDKKQGIVVESIGFDLCEGLKTNK